MSENITADPSPIAVSAIYIRPNDMSSNNSTGPAKVPV